MAEHKRERLEACPECGRSLDNLKIDAHAEQHWPRLDEQDTRYVEARRRKALLLDEHKARQREG